MERPSEKDKVMVKLAMKELNRKQRRKWFKEHGKAYLRNVEEQNNKQEES